MARDPYEVLGIKRDANLDEVRTAYHNAALKYHPDAFEGDRQEAERVFREVASAYERILLERSASPGLSRKALSPADLGAMQMARSLMGEGVPTRRSRRKAVRRFVLARSREFLVVLIGVVLLLWTGCLLAVTIGPFVVAMVTAGDQGRQDRPDHPGADESSSWDDVGIARKEVALGTATVSLALAVAYFRHRPLSGYQSKKRGRGTAVFVIGTCLCALAGTGLLFPRSSWVYLLGGPVVLSSPLAMIYLFFAIPGPLLHWMRRLS